LGYPPHPRDLLFQDSYVYIIWSENPLVDDSISSEQYMKMGHVTTEFFFQPAQISFEEDSLEQQGTTRRLEVIAP
jgi:hypothetical protein